MTQFAPGMIIEVLLIALLLVTVGYCMALSRRLSRLRSSQHDLRQIIGELCTATQTAENAIRGLKSTTQEADARLTEKLHKAQLLSRELALLAEASRAGPLHGSGRVVAGAAEPAPGETLPDPQRWRQIAMSRLNGAS